MFPPTGRKVHESICHIALVVEIEAQIHEVTFARNDLKVRRQSLQFLHSSVQMPYLLDAVDELFSSKLVLRSVEEGTLDT